MKSGTKSERSSESDTSARALRISAAGTTLGSVRPTKSDKLKRKKWNGTNSCGDVRSSVLVDEVEPV